MIENYDFRPDFVVPLEFGAKKIKDKSKGQSWNRTRAGTSKARLGTQKALRERSGKQNIKHH
jgi:hypothetical protein